MVKSIEESDNAQNPETSATSQRASLHQRLDRLFGLFNVCRDEDFEPDESPSEDPDNE